MSTGGQRQRVALARTLLQPPRLRLLDEPLGALDALTRIEMQRLVETPWREHGCTAVLVTHDASEALSLADRVILLDAGRTALDRRIDLPRPRIRGSTGFAALEGGVLRRVIGPDRRAAAGTGVGATSAATDGRAYTAGVRMSPAARAICSPAAPRGYRTCRN